jgi:2-amino-4-hydroxy-6-hydroxymethyldihydropteridine diphosphokinase
VVAKLAYVGLGGNLALPARQIGVALHRLAGWPGVAALRASRLYRTAPWGREDQPPFVNAAAEVHYVGEPEALLRALLAIEREAGRSRGAERWGPRLLDLDLLLFGQRRIALHGLTVPHPHIAQRAFVLVPLAELAPELLIPGVGKVSACLDAIDASQVAELDCLH